MNTLRTELGNISTVNIYMAKLIVIVDERNRTIKIEKSRYSQRETLNMIWDIYPEYNIWMFGNLWTRKEKSNE